ncbi:MAG: NAD(+) synthase [Candidatus Krumholzibacteriota bacterium]|nr:NAD(+) synthase [Candidatus Krumholzibacteriota bacterium]
MEFTNSVLDIEAEKLTNDLVGFIRDQVKNVFHRKGIIIGLSGGIDSSVAAALSVRALGPDRVFGVILPEKDSSPDSSRFGRLCADSLGIGYNTVEITPMLTGFGVYAKRNSIVKKYFPDYDGEMKFRLTLPQDLLERDRISAYHLDIEKKDGKIESIRLAHKDYLKMMAANVIKQRVRMTQMYYEADKRYYIVCGTTNLPETIQGFFVKYGDGGVDIEPLANLYKKQVFDLGKYLGVPNEIIQRTPTPDTYSLPVSDEDFYFCMPYNTFDLVLYAALNGIPADIAAASIGLTVEQIERAWKDLDRKKKTTETLRMLPPSPERSLS